MISETMLKKWKTDALIVLTERAKGNISIYNAHTVQLSDRINKLTQELLDVKLLERRS